jgi:hypothetical protein
MAELIIPILTLGSLYIYSNKDKSDKKLNQENFSNINNLPNTNIINNNFPNTEKIDIKGENYVKKYNNANQTTDKFFNNNQNNNQENLNLEFKSMNGNEININEFKHNNMVPFFGAKVTGPQVDNNDRLDGMIGNSKYDIKRSEQASLFKPVENIENVFGSKNNSDFIQSRQLPSQKINNVLPWEQEKVAPGLGLCYGTEGVGGFNSGMMSRENWQPPTVDKLRTTNNQKETYSYYGYEGPAQSKVTNTGNMGTMEKNRPDTDYKLGSDRWFTSTNSNNLAQTQRGICQLNNNNRMETTNEYYGVKSIGDGDKPNYYRGNYEPSQKPELGSTQIPIANATGNGNSNDLTLRSKSYNILNNNRNDNHQPDTINSGGINATFKAILAPVIDILKPTRKENVIGNANQTGNIKALVPNLPITNPYDKPKTTIKEMNVDKIGLDHLNVSHISSGNNGAYINSNFELKNQERNTTDYSNFGNMQGQGNQMLRNAWDNQHNNVNKTSVNRPNPGGMDSYNNYINMTMNKNQCDVFNTREPVPDKKLANPNNFSQYIPSTDILGRMEPVNQLSNTINEDRMNPDILSAFKNNPYAQSLNSY